MSNEFDNVIMVAIVITCRANEIDEKQKKNKWEEILRLYAPCSRHEEDYTIVVVVHSPQYIIMNGRTDSTCLL